MRCVRTPIEAEVTKYEVGKGLEDGFELWNEVVTGEWINTEGLVKIEKDNLLKCPFIFHRRGRTFIKEGDYIVVDDDGTKHACGEDKIFERYSKLSD